MLLALIRNLICGESVSRIADENREIPQLETERLRLRAHRREDLEDSVKLWSDPEVARYIGGKPLSREEVWSRILRYVGHWMWMKYGYWVVEEKQSGGFVGEVGWAMYKRDIEPRMDDTPEVGWVLSPQFHGRGYATEAVRCAIGWGEQQFPGRKTMCLIDPANGKSIRVAERCGFRELRRTSYKGMPVIIFEH